MTTAADPAAATAERATAPPAAAPRARTFAPVLLVLFAGSGCAALVYEVVWFHLLRFVVGGSSISLGFLLGSFMGGMGLGSLLSVAKKLQPNGGKLAICGLTGMVKEVFRLSGFDKLIPGFENADAAFQKL